jgi:hypothetical protein
MVNSIIDVTQWLDMIKQKSPTAEMIIRARQNPDMYEYIKRSIPCVTYNFKYNGYKRDENIEHSTGILYIDIDAPDFEVNNLDKSKVFSFYHSFGGQGYAILVKVLGLTPNNFKETYQYIVEDLGLKDYVDRRAIKPSQFNVLSYDEDLFLNMNSSVFPSIPAPQSSQLIKEEIYTKDSGANYSIRYDNLNEIEINGNYVVNWEGYDYIRCFIPFTKVRKGNRNASLLSYCNNLIYLNPTIRIERATKIMNAVNERMCHEPMSEYEINQIIHSIYRYKEEGSLKPILYHKKRKIVFSPYSELSREDKLDICIKEIAQHRRDLSEQKLRDIFENWDFEKYGKITQRKVFNNFPISKKTTAKYWYLVKVMKGE